MTGRRALNSRLTRRPETYCNYNNAICARIILVVLVFAFLLYQRSWESYLTIPDGRPREISSVDSKKLRAAISSDVPLPLDIYSADTTIEITPEYSYVDVPDSYYNVESEEEYYDDASFQREGYDNEYLETKPLTDDVSVSLIGNHSLSNQKPPIERIALLGERNTGTRWMTTELAKCFPTLNVQPRLVRWKHWFQHDLPHTDGSPQETTLVVAQFRNVYEWIEAMRKVPHHAPLHLRKRWKTFVTKPWTMERPKRDEPYKKNLFTTLNKTTHEPVWPLCFEKFYYNQIISCIEGSRNDTSYESYGCNPDKDFSCHKPNYELKHNIDMSKLTGEGEAYNSIIDLRRDKIINFVKEVKEFPWVIDVIDVQYEKLLSDGTEFLLKKIEKISGLKRKCEATSKQTRKKREISPNMMQWLNDNVDWETEGLIGYTKLELMNGKGEYKPETEEKDDDADQEDNAAMDSTDEDDDKAHDEPDENNSSDSIVEENKNTVDDPTDKAEDLDGKVSKGIKKLPKAEE